MNLTAIRNEPCGRCGWKYPGYHLCLNLSEPMMQKVGPTVTKRVRKKAESSSTEDRESNARLRDVHFKERNKKIVRLYAVEKMSMGEIAKELLIDDSTVMNVLHTAKDRGEITIRKTVRRVGSK